MKVFVQTIVAALSISLAAQADTLRLQSGEAIDGTLISADTRNVRFLADSGDLKTYPVAQVRSVIFGDTKAEAPQAPARSRAESAAGSPAQTRGKSVIRPGTVLTVRMIDSIDSDASHSGETYQASLAEDVIVDGETVAAKGADATVKVVRVKQSGRLKGREEVALALTEITVDGKPHELITGFAEVAGKSKGEETAKVVGAGAAVGAVIGAIAGGGKGAAVGAATGAGAGTAIQVLRGDRLKIPSETLLDFTLTEEVAVP